jgi:hypothetical protein
MMMMMMMMMRMKIPRLPCYITFSKRTSNKSGTFKLRTSMPTQVLAPSSWWYC